MRNADGVPRGTIGVYRGGHLRRRPQSELLDTGVSTGSQNERVATIVSLTRGPRVLHVGCCGNRLPQTPGDWGDFAHGQLVDAGFDVLGCDISDDGLAWMREHGYDAVYLDAEHLEGELRFDTIVAGELIEHLENPGLFLAGCARLLEPHGRLILSTPNPFSVFYSLIFLKDGSGRPFHYEHTGWFCGQTLAQRLERAGLRVEEIRYIDDLRPEGSCVGPVYRLFARSWLRLRPFLPNRYRNTVVVVATPGS
jgi:2-polyprenyl-3-methyl-5-hydroxy-6-metoxy-1,4-benzoquinol methylase